MMDVYCDNEDDASFKEIAIVKVGYKNYKLIPIDECPNSDSDGICSNGDFVCKNLLYISRVDDDIYIECYIRDIYNI